MFQNLPLTMFFYIAIFFRLLLLFFKFHFTFQPQFSLSLLLLVPLTSSSAHLPIIPPNG